MEGRSSKTSRKLPVLIAMNKMDLFTALPLQKAQLVLEAELARIHSTSSQTLWDSAKPEFDHSIGEDDWLSKDRAFLRFSQMDKISLEVSVVGGVASGAEGSNIDIWKSWIVTHTNKLK